ncbi:DUF423 domain-containing protein [Oryzibacter oryziterrae]|uniref:DUF423 domain-containing protein n=1 Tax=Oryzibacter oryziterrae TaxID=2766474 RepID=UPI001F3180FA|nr:DUF423 domain-containing protein [Oryzibacter oryziterrae]
MGSDGDKVIGVIAGLAGALGVALLAAASHAYPGSHLDTAGLILLLHAAALLALTNGSLGPARLRLLGGGVMALGMTLFAGDLALRAFADTRLFPMAAPTGGLLLIASWLIVSLAFAVRR